MTRAIALALFVALAWGVYTVARACGAPLWMALVLVACFAPTVAVVATTRGIK